MVFTLFLWLLMLLILFSSKYNKANQWCALSILVLSFGTLKEFLYYDLPLLNLKNNGIQLSFTISKTVYSGMTAILYYLAMPCGIIFALYFSKLLNDKTKQVIFLIKLFVFLPSLLLFLTFEPAKTILYQHTSMQFWYVVTSYNLLYGFIVTTLMIFAVISEKSPIQIHQNRMVSLIVLPPLWYWLITIFLVHSLQITALYKIWKDNIMIILLSILIYIGFACTEGIMGLKLYTEHFHWNSKMQITSKSLHSTVHMLKSQINKIDWCVQNLRETENMGELEEIKIIDHSIKYIKDFMSKTQMYASDITLELQPYSVTDIIKNAIANFNDAKESGIQFKWSTESDTLIICDPIHLTEVFHNFLCNAAEAMNHNGIITIRTDRSVKKNMCVITISDTGCGIPKQYRTKIFNPCFSTKKTDFHFGLGLSYCYNVIQKHRGFIQLKSEEGKGTDFFIYLPVK